MAYTVPFNDILKELKERKQFEAERAKKNKDEKCKGCGHNLMAIGKSNIPGVCNICVSLALIPEP